MHQYLSLENFRTLYGLFGNLTEDAEIVFIKYGKIFSAETSSVMWHAANHNMLDSALCKLNSYYRCTLNGKTATCWNENKAIETKRFLMGLIEKIRSGRFQFNFRN